MAILVHDTFSGESSNVGLSSHVGEIGASWTVLTGLAIPSVNAAASNVFVTGTASFGAYASGVPASEEYDITADLSNFSGSLGVVGRASTSAQTFYHGRYLTGSAWQLYRFNSGTATLLGSYSVTESATKTIKLEIRNASKKVFVDGTERISSGDNAITDAGRSGVRFNGASTATRLDNFLAEDLSSGGGGETITISKASFGWNGKPAKANSIPTVTRTSLLWSGQTVSGSTTITTGATGIEWSGKAAKANQTASVQASSFEWAGKTVKGNQSTTVGKASLSWIGRAVNATAGQIIMIGKAVFSWAGQEVKGNQTARAGTSTFTWRGRAVTIAGEFIQRIKRAGMALRLKLGL